MCVFFANTIELWQEIRTQDTIEAKSDAVTVVLTSDLNFYVLKQNIAVLRD